MFTKIVIANRGEIALRILRACRQLGIKTVATHSLIDRDLKHVRLADETVCIGGNSATDSYLNIPSIIAAAEVTNSQAIHPGYGLLSENADFAERAEQSGFTFIGPSPNVIRSMGNKVEAIRMMKQAGLKTIPGSNGPLDDDIETTKQIASEIGFPVLIKAAAGGGGRGMRVVDNIDGIEDAVEMTRSEATAAFGDSTVYMEKFLRKPRHVEVQILGDTHGNILHFFDRDCSVQRRHQKILEEAPATNLDQGKRSSLLKACVKACENIGYVGAGTFEFLMEENEFYFIEMNTRIQVEHPVTEMITGTDLVLEQIRISAGEPILLKQKEIKVSGHAVECRINAEHPRTFIPSPGKVTRYHPPGGLGVRVDSHLYGGYDIPPYYDSLIAKFITHGTSRAEAIQRMKIALSESIIEGINTNMTLHAQILEDKNFLGEPQPIKFLENNLLENF